MNTKIRVYLFQAIDYYIYMYIYFKVHEILIHDMIKKKKGEKSGEKHIVDVEYFYIIIYNSIGKKIYLIICSTQLSMLRFCGS